ncbi:MAG: HTH domain-containing protein [Anaeromyxobacteraceae bacterium]
MTFTEAAIEVLRREGKPLHFKKIAEIAVRDSLLDHVGKIPDEVMGGQLATHCRLPHTDRKVIAVQSGTFALVEWGLDEDPVGLEQMIEPPPDIDIPYRPRERHPIPAREIARAPARTEPRARRREEGGEERRGRRYPPPAEVAYEILAGAERPLSLGDIAAQGAERLLMPDAFVRETSALAAALVEDNRRREGQGRRALFALDGELVSLAAEPEPGERAATPLAPARPATAPADVRRAALAALRRRLKDCDGPTVEHVVAKLLERMEVRELKVAKRGRDHVVYTGRRKLGLGDVRHCVRILRAGSEATRRDVTDLRKDVGNYGAQIGVLVSSGDAARDARGEASAPGQLPVLLLCGDALAEAFTEFAVGCRPIVVPEIDEGFFKEATDAAQQEDAARRVRREERDKRDDRADGRPPRERREPSERGREERAAEPERASVVVEVLAERLPGGDEGEGDDGAAEVAVDVVSTTVARDADDLERERERERPPRPAAATLAPAADDDDEGDDEDGEGEGEAATAGPGGAQAAAEGEAGQGEVRRRRRRRRRRGGRGRNREGAAGNAAIAPGETAPAQAQGPGGDPAPGAVTPEAESASAAASGVGPAPEPTFAAPPVDAEPARAPESSHAAGPWGASAPAAPREEPPPLPPADGGGPTEGER